MTSVDFEEKNIVRFDPLMSVQRYRFVREVIESDPKLESVVDLGCANGQFLRHLKNIESLRRILLVDVVYGCVESAQHFARPLAWDHLFRRKKQLDIYLYCGSAAERDSRIKDIDVVSAIELVEHLEESVLNGVRETIFSWIRPKVAIITTPNRDFNVVFSDDMESPQKFRHWDHKFEWTRQEFEAWCLDIIRDYCEYSVDFSGVGEVPANITEERGTNFSTEVLGYCTQIAIFRRVTQDDEIAVQSTEELTPYDLIFHETFPGGPLENPLSDTNEQETGYSSNKSPMADGDNFSDSNDEWNFSEEELGEFADFVDDSTCCGDSWDETTDFWRTDKDLKKSREAVSTGTFSKLVSFKTLPIALVFVAASLFVARKMFHFR